MKIKIKKFPIPGWAAAVLTTLWCEGLLYLWTTEEFSAPRFLTVLVFALGLGCLVGQILSFIGHRKWGKWVGVTILTLIAAFYLVSFFVWQFFGVFYTPATMLKGAGGVATGFAGDAIMTALKGLWRIALMLLPPIGYGIFAAPVKTGWRVRWLTLAGAIAAYILGFCMVQTRPADAARLSDTYQYDSAINAFGLHIAAVLDSTRGGEKQTGGGDFLIPAPAPVETQPAPGQQGETGPETDEPPVVYEPNIMDFDFAALAAEEKNRNIANIHQYVGSLTPTMKNEYTGLLEGKNLIFITAEALSQEVIDPELTPTLYRLANEGIRFQEYYQPKWGAGTTSGEYSNLTGLVPTNGGSCMFEPKQQDMFLLIGKQLQKQGYTSGAYHPNDYKFYSRNTTHEHLGYDVYMGYGNGMEDGVTGQWPQSDLEMMEFTLPMHLGKGPFSLYYMSVSGHSVYTVKGNAMSRKNYDEVSAFAEKTGKTWSEPILCYMAANLELEKALAYTLEELDKAGELEDTVIVISPDHFPYGLENTRSRDGRQNCLEELYGDIPKIYHDHNALIIWSPCLEDMDIVVTDPVYSLDILPTISNLFGVPYDSRLLVGRDALSTAEPLVLWPTFSWKTDRGYYNASTGEFIPTEGAAPADEAYIERISAIVQNKIRYSNQVTEWNYFNFLSDTEK